MSDETKNTASFTCIVCPNGCELLVTKTGGGYEVTGNRCKRGEEFGTGELTDPRRTVCSTVKTGFPGVPALPVRTSGEIPKNRIDDVMDEIKKVRVTRPVGRGDAVIKNVLSLGVDVIATSDILKKR